MPDHRADFDSRFLAGAFGSPDYIKCRRRRGTRSMRNHMEGISWQSQAGREHGKDRRVL